MNWNIAFLVALIGIAGLIFYDGRQDTLLDKQEALEAQMQHQQELEENLKRQRELLAEEERKRQQKIAAERQRLEDDLALQQMQNEATRARLEQERQERAEQIEKEIQLEKAAQDFNNRAWARQAYEECLREVDNPDKCPDYNELQERLAD